MEAEGNINYGFLKHRSLLAAVDPNSLYGQNLLRTSIPAIPLSVAWLPLYLISFDKGIKKSHQRHLLYSGKKGAGDLPNLGETRFFRIWLACPVWRPVAPKFVMLLLIIEADRTTLHLCRHVLEMHGCRCGVPSTPQFGLCFWYGQGLQCPQMQPLCLWYRQMCFPQGLLLFKCCRLLNLN